MRGGIKTVLIPEENEKDLAEIPDNVKEGLEIIPVSHVSEVLKLALWWKSPRRWNGMKPPKRRPRPKRRADPTSQGRARSRTERGTGITMEKGAPKGAPFFIAKGRAVRFAEKPLPCARRLEVVHW